MSAVTQRIANVCAGMKHLLMMLWVPEPFSQRFAAFSALVLLQHVCHVLPVDEAYTHVYFHGLDITQLGLAHKLASEIGSGLGINFWSTILGKLFECMSAFRTAFESLSQYVSAMRGLGYRFG